MSNYLNFFLLNMSCLDLPYIKKPPGRGVEGDGNG
jgi:hypothetical protein